MSADFDELVEVVADAGEMLEAACAQCARLEAVVEAAQRYALAAGDRRLERILDAGDPEEELQRILDGMAARAAGWHRGDGSGLIYTGEEENV